MNNEMEHICVCVCTYRRPQRLRRLLDGLGEQTTGGLFTHSIVVVDNDYSRSAEVVVRDYAASSCIPIRYCVEPVRSIPLARNRAVENAIGDYLAFIDDDEFPINAWLLTLFKTCKQCDVDGVLGPVNPFFEDEPPKWIVRGKFWQRPNYPTGMIIDGGKGRTGNVLLKKEVFADSKEPFQPRLQTGEDQDFFSRMIEAGRVFAWCSEATVYEKIPPERWKRSFILRRSLFQGSFVPIGRTFSMARLGKSLIAIPVYVVILPFEAFLGHHRFMITSAKLVYHLGTVLGCVGIRLIDQPYVTG